MRLIGQAALRLDDFLRRSNRVTEYSSDPHCVFRMQIGEARQDAVLPDGAFIHRGDKIVDLHLWNEHVPVIPPEGPTMAWGRRMGSNMNFSLRQLAAFFACHAEFDHVAAVRCKLAVATAIRTGQLLRMMQHYGFEIVADGAAVSWRQRLHDWGQNILSLLLLMAVNPESARLSVLWRVRSQVLLSRKNFDRRYGACGAVNASPELEAADFESRRARLRSPSHV
jgi:hypothetical protein